MKITTLTTLTTLLTLTPLTLAATTLETDMRKRGLLTSSHDIILGGVGSTETQTTQTETSQKGNDQKGASSSKGISNSNSQQHGGGSVNSGIKSITTTSSTEIILIWVNPGNNAATTTINSVAAASTVAAASVATHTVVVGGTTKVYNPNTIQAAVGDMVLFHFQAQNHTATQSAFAAPCVKLAGGMDTGFMANPNGTINPPPMVAMQVNVSTPLWFYCRQTGHCGEGMTFSINPTANKTQAAFEALAIAQNGTGSTAGIASVSVSGAAGSAATATTVAVSAATSTVAAAGSATSISSANTGGTVVSGQGTLDGTGACVCSVQCGVGTFPNVAVQGIAAFGGMQGQIATSAMEVTA